MKNKKELSPLLPTLKTVADLRAIPDRDIPRLSREIRDYLIKHTEEHGGHLASNLGVVELTLALHRVFNTPQDRVIWDVGHQCYVHKIVTGRLAEFDTLRTPGGLSGFTRRSEGPFDPFGSGHASTSISAALGFAEADFVLGETDKYTIAVIGDGALTGGLAHEAINNCRKDLPLIIVINENEMSISRVTGAFPHLVARLRISRSYRSVKRRTKRFLKKIPIIGRPLYRFVRWIRNGVRGLLYESNYFEEMGFAYLGPYDGCNYRKVKNALEEAKEKHCCAIIHLRTVKGKGCAEAEANPDTYHCLYQSSVKAPGKTYHAFVGETLCTMAAQDPHVCVITPATSSTTGLKQFSSLYPDRFFDVGIAEGHALTFAAGLAAGGMKPYAVIYSSFLQRGYDQIIHDIALQHLPVHMFIDRASLAPSDGVTHHGIYDVAFLSELPEIAIYAPSNLETLAAILRDTADAKGPVAVRYPNGTENAALKRTFYADGDYDAYGVRAAGELGPSCRAVIVSYGPIAVRAQTAMEKLKEQGIQTGMLLLEKLNPTEEIAAQISALVPSEAVLVFLEEGIYNGGAGMILTDALRAIRPELRSTVLAVRDPAAQPEAPCDLYDFYGISADHTVDAVRKLLGN